jgi:glycosyltransferase involved in cell wall biosynthesis
MVVYRLLKNLASKDFCLISRPSYVVDADLAGPCSRLTGRHYVLPAQFRVPKGSAERSVTKWRKRLNPLRVFVLARQIAAILRRERCEAVVACSGALLDPPASYLASRLVGVPFYAYLFDYYSCQWIGVTERLFARLVEPRLLRGAAGIIVPNEFLRDSLCDRYGVDSTIIRNPCDTNEYDRPPPDVPHWHSRGIRIVYTGAVYEAQYDAFRNLLSAVESLGPSRVSLHLYTAQSLHELKKMGICGPIALHDHQPLRAIAAIQRQADILFLPLAFASPYPEVIRTSAPGKMGEYLASRRPVLVHAPSDSFVAWYFRRHKCGLVVGRSDPMALAQAVERLAVDEDLRRTLTSRAWDRARSDFDSSTARARFYQLMRLDVPR